jgi:DNA repair exonuclease SbcCD ATPase subunit
MIFFAGYGLAQDGDVVGSVSSLQQGLSNLKQSVEKMGLSNAKLAMRDNDMKQQIIQLEMQLGRLQDQGHSLDKAVEVLRQENPRRTRQVERLEAQNDELVDRIHKAQAGIKSGREALGEGSELSHSAEDRQKEKLKLMKMIYESQQRQVSLHANIQEIQKSTPLPPPTAAHAIQWDNSQLQQLQLELNFLERNYAQLKDLIQQMERKNRNTRAAVGEHVEEQKLQAAVDDLKRQGVKLMLDLSDLRSQMVDLDKRKTQLENMVQHSS